MASLCNLHCNDQLQKSDETNETIFTASILVTLNTKIRSMKQSFQPVSFGPFNRFLSANILIKIVLVMCATEPLKIGACLKVLSVSANSHNLGSGCCLFSAHHHTADDDSDTKTQVQSFAPTPVQSHVHLSERSVAFTRL